MVVIVVGGGGGYSTVSGRVVGGRRLVLVGQSLVDGGAATVTMLDGSHGRGAGRGAQVWRRRFTTLALEEPDKNPFESPVEHGVNQRIDGRRDVAEPQAGRHQPVRYVNAARRPHHQQQIE